MAKPRLVCLCTMLALVSSCNVPAGENSDIKGLAANEKATNIGLVMIAEMEQGRAVNVTRMQEFLSDKRLGFSLRNYDTLTKEKILAYSADAAKAVGADGTLLWYLNTHGDKSGDLVTRSEKLKFREVVTAMRKARSTPVRRVIFLLDSCYSGNNTDPIESANLMDDPGDDANAAASGSDLETEGPLPEEIGPSDENYSLVEALVSDEESSGPDAAGGKNLGNLAAGASWFKQALIFAPSSKTQKTRRGAFTAALNNTFKKLSSDRSAKIRSFVSGVAKQLSSQGAVYKTFPNSSILDDTLVGTNGSSSGATTQPSPKPTPANNIPSKPNISKPPPGNSGSASNPNSSGTTATKACSAGQVRHTCQCNAAKSICYAQQVATDPETMCVVAGLCK